MSARLRQVHRAYVEAGLMPLSDYIAEYGDEPVSPAPSYPITINALPLPEGFKQIMRHMGIEATGLIINGSMGFTVFDKHGTAYLFNINSVTVQE